MKPIGRALAAAGLLVAATQAQKIEFEKPFRVEAGGAAIDVTIGHAAPWMKDMDGDGLPDLLVGQFGDGKLRVYKNVGTKNAPAFKDFVFAKACGADATVPSG
jgi:hypothetical protein